MSGGWNAETKSAGATERRVGKYWSWGTSSKALSIGLEDSLYQVVRGLRQHLLDLLVAQHDLDDWLAAVLEGGVVVVHVRGYEYLGVP